MWKFILLIHLFVIVFIFVSYTLEICKHIICGFIRLRRLRRTFIPQNDVPPNSPYYFNVYQEV